MSVTGGLGSAVSETDADGHADARIRVVIADDQQLIRAGFRALLESVPEIEVVAEAATGRQAVAQVTQHRPDVVLMDIRMPDGDGLWATEQIVRDPTLSATHIVIVTTFELDEYVAHAIRAGASGFLVKDTEPTELIRAVRVVAAGDGLLSPGVTRRLLERMAASLVDSRDAASLDVLTEREREVLGLVGRGLTNAEIGVRLFLSPLTAKTHVSRIMTKLGARDRVQLVIIAYEAGLVSPGL
jgi:DNA-binding NarL/FixJ family response regulator